MGLLFFLHCEEPAGVGIKPKPHLGSPASFSKEMSTLAQDFWNSVPAEILVHIFSYLPLKERHAAFQVCQSWAEAAHTTSIWTFTEISCNAEDMDQGCVVQRLLQFLCHIKHLKIVLEGSREANRKHLTQILDMLLWQNNEVRALSMVCQGRHPPYFYSDQDLQLSFSSLRDLHYIDFRQTSFTLDNETVLLMAACSPNLRALLINSRLSPFYILRAETIAEVLRMCPKLSALGVQHATLSREVFQELLKPSRDPFHFLDIFCEGLNDDIPEELWSALIEKHPQLSVGFVFCFTVPYVNMSAILKPNIPVTALQFKYSYRLVGLIQLVTNHYSRTLERLDLNTNPSDDLNMSLMELARNCVCLKEIHCSCTVSQAVEDTFLLYCPGLIKYTLKT